MDRTRGYEHQTTTTVNRRTLFSVQCSEKWICIILKQRVNKTGRAPQFHEETQLVWSNGLFQHDRRSAIFVSSRAKRSERAVQDLR